MHAGRNEPSSPVQVKTESLSRPDSAAFAAAFGPFATVGTFASVGATVAASQVTCLQRARRTRRHSFVFSRFGFVLIQTLEPNVI